MLAATTIIVPLQIRDTKKSRLLMLLAVAPKYSDSVYALRTNFTRLQSASWDTFRVTLPACRGCSPLIKWRYPITQNLLFKFKTFPLEKVWLLHSFDLTILGVGGRQSS